MGKIEISPVGWVCIFALGCKYPDLWMYLLVSFFILLFLLLFVAIAIGSDYQSDLDPSYSKVEVVDSSYSKVEVVDSSYPNGYWEKYSTDLRNKEIEAAASVKRGKEIWEERKKEIKKEEEEKKQENIDKQVEQWKQEAREKLNS